MRKFLAAAAVSAIVVLTAIPARAAGGATVRGKIVNGTTKEPAARIDVILEQGNEQTQSPGEKRSGTTDDGGNFVFTGVEGGSPWVYDIAVRYKGETYYSEQLNPGESGTATTTTTIYDPTSSPQALTIPQWVVFVEQDPQGVAVEQDVTISNGGKEAYTGNQTQTTGDSVTVQLPVAPTALANTFQYDGLMLNCCPTIGTDTVVHTAPILPGRDVAVMRYVTPVPDSLDFPVTLPTDQMVVFAGTGVTLTPTGLTQSGEQAVDGKQYTVFTASNLAPGATPSLAVSAGGGGSKIPAPAAILLAAAGLAALFLLVVKLRSGVEAPVRTGPRKAPQQVKRRAPRPRKPSESHPADEEDLEEDLLVAEIATLDLSFEQGLIAEDDYRSLRAARKAELLRMKRESEG